MAVDLTKPASQVDVDSAAYEPMLKNMQGNILRPHGRNAERHVFLTFTGPPAKVKAWIRDKIVPRLLTSFEQFEQAKKRDADKSFDGGFVTLFYLSAEGYRFLGFDPKKFESRIFRKGMKDRGDDLIAELFSTTNKDPKPSQWEPGFQKVIHAMVQLGDDQAAETRLLNALSLLNTELAGIATVAAVETGKALRRTVRDGATLKDPEPIEHFGYFDGISQPLFTKRDLDRYYAKGEGAGPGIGWDPGASLDLVLADDPFTSAPDAFGSYLVYRKLAQDYDLFHQRVADCATAVGIDDTLAGAMAVGRFEDGTPVVDFDKPAQKYNNDFIFKTLDPDGFRCPAHAHARKVNPRGTTPQTSLDKERRRRIARRGIPYGKPMPAVGCPPADSDPNNKTPRGLLFMCFQANVEKQFEFIQRTWVDNPNFPTNVLNLPTGKDTGDDPVIGQDNKEDQRWPKKWGDKNAGRQKFNFEGPVTLKGGEYFFAPSKPFLAGL